MRRIAYSERSRAAGRSIWRPALALVLITALAAAFRFWKLDSIPPGFHYDEAYEAGEAWRVITQPGYHPIFFPGNFGVEPMFIYLTALAFRLFGPAPVVMRGVAALAGTLTIPALYAFGCELVEADRRRPKQAKGQGGQVDEHWLDAEVAGEENGVITRLRNHTPGFPGLVGLVIVESRRDAVQFPETESGGQRGDQDQHQCRTPDRPACRPTPLTIRDASHAGLRSPTSRGFSECFPVGDFLLQRRGHRLRAAGDALHARATRQQSGFGIGRH